MSILHVPQDLVRGDVAAWKETSKKVVVSRNSAQRRERHTRGVSEADDIGECEVQHDVSVEFRSAREECALHRADHWPARA